jgi:fatty acid CoA ligase FadD36
VTTLLTALNGDLPDSDDAVVVDGQAASWAHLHTAASGLAGRIAGARAIAVPATPSLPTVTAVVAGLLAGVPVVPLAADSGPLEREHILRDSGAELIVTGEPGPGNELSTAELSAPPQVAYPDGTALVLYTSGTTGRPKGAAISAGAATADLDAIAQAWAWSPDDVLVHGLPLNHVHGLVLGVLGALRVGCKLRHTGRPTPQAYAAAGGTLYFGVPTIWSRVVGDPAGARALAGARLLVSGSAPLSPTVFAALRDLTGHEPVERYGMTETLITVSTRAHGPRRPGCVGTPVAGIATRIAAADGESGAGGEPGAGGKLDAGGESGAGGELEVRGPTLFSGYLGRPEATAACFTPDGWFRTGDAAAIAADGAHRIIGRIATDLIKSGGYRIGAGEVEEALLAHPAVREAAVVGAPHADLGQQIVAYVVADGVSEQQLIEHVARGLSVHKRPRQVRFVDALPRNAMGKVQKLLLGSE